MVLLRNRRAELLAAAVTLLIIISFFLLPRSAEGVDIVFGGCAEVDVGATCILTVTIGVLADEFVSSVQLSLEDGAAAPIFDGPIPLESDPSDLIPGELTVDVTFGGGIGYGYGEFFGYGYGFGYGFSDGGFIRLDLTYTPGSSGTHTVTVSTISTMADGSPSSTKEQDAEIVVNPALTPTPPPSSGGGGGAAIPTATPTVVPVDSDGGVVAIVESDEETTVSLGGVTLVVPACPLEDSTQVRLRSLDAASLSEQPDGAVLYALDIEFFDAQGDLIEDTVLCDNADLTVGLTEDNVEALGGAESFDAEAGAGRIFLQRLEPGGWSTLPTSVDLAGRTFTTSLSEFSVFALVASEAPEPVPISAPPPPGGAPATATPPTPTATATAPVPTATATAPPPAVATQLPPAPTSTAVPAAAPTPTPLRAAPPVSAAPVPAPTVAAPVPPPPVAAAAPVPTPQSTAVAPAPVVDAVSSGVPFWIWLMLGAGVLLIGASLFRAYRLYYQSE